MTKRCVICKGVIEVEAISGWADGYNAEPVADGRCCKICDNSVVLRARLLRLYDKEIIAREGV